MTTRTRPRLGPALRRTFDCGVHAAASVLHLMPKANPARYGVTLERDIAYLATGKRAHRLDVYRPEASGPRPVVVYVHGGAFAMLSKDTHRVMALQFAARGYVVVNINYRLGPTHQYPSQLEDAAAALEWVMDHAAEHGGDPTRLVLAGESAGANLVTALTIASTERRPEPFAARLFERAPSLRAVLPIYGLLDLHDLHRILHHPRLGRWARYELLTAGASYVGRPIRERAPLAPLASPLRLLQRPAPEGSRPLPPFFVAVGTADPLLDDSRRLRVAIEARGGSCVLAIYPGEIHGFNAMLWRPAAQAKWRAVAEFLEQHVPLEDGAPAAR